MQPHQGRDSLFSAVTLTPLLKIRRLFLGFCFWALCLSSDPLFTLLVTPGRMTAAAS